PTARSLSVSLHDALPIFATTFFLVAAFILMLSRFGKIRLGPDDSRPEFGTVAWFAMLFTTGMGIGLVFWGVAEPVTHLHNQADADRKSTRLNSSHVSSSY